MGARRAGAWRQLTKRRRTLGVALSLAVHLMILLALAPAIAPKAFEPRAVTVQLVSEPSPVTAVTSTKSPAPPAPKRLADAKRPRARALARPSPAPPRAESLAAADVYAEASQPGLSDAQLAGAASADSGSGGRACDMARRLQEALRKDPLVRSSVAGLAGKAVMVWNGDWVWFRGDVGKGLTAVRQAMMWEIAFAPEACRSQPMHGLVVISVNEAQGSTRLAVGSAEWRWSDLLIPHPGVVGADPSAQ